VSAALRFLAAPTCQIDKVRAVLGQISEASRHVDTVMEGIRALYKKTDQGQQLLEINEIILDVVRSMDREFSDCEVVTSLELASDLPAIRGHRGQLLEVMSNLFRNAIEAMGTTVNRKRELSVRTELRAGNAISVAVEDSGPGISQSTLPHIFNAFVTTKRHGTGLGLAICQSIIEFHGGRITASSAGANGARFEIVLPVNFSPIEGVQALVN
jgi:signal transduction histidine kinase